MAVDTKAFLETLAQRRSCKDVGDKAPTDDELNALLPAVVQVANHGKLNCWRMHTIRGKDRHALGIAFNKAAGKKGKKPHKKALSAPLLIAIIASPKTKGGVPAWEQMATATGAAFFMATALWASGWGVVWRSGSWTSAKEVKRFHGLKKGEQLLGWLYVGNPKKKRKLYTNKVRKIQPDLISPLP
ncbi:nitroreductase family protein [Stomatohabitans albus]|uniref:nitroreductase family protein n=1 Tax=Stomatohabitans albus TaxID=3110766 RepID=UPI00300C256C